VLAVLGRRPQGIAGFAELPGGRRDGHLPPSRVHLGQVAVGQDLRVLADLVAVLHPRPRAAQVCQPGLDLREGEPADNFYVITRGQVEVVLRQPNGSEIVVTTMGVGQYFGEIELLHGSANIATIRAGFTTGVEVIVLDHAEFSHLVAESPTTQATIDRVAHQRVAENTAARQDEKEVGVHA